MSELSSDDLTVLLVRGLQGDNCAESEVAELLLPHFRRMAKCRVKKGRPGHTLLEVTGLATETWEKLWRSLKGTGKSVHSRGQFFAFAAITMERVVIEYVNRRRTQKRAGGMVKHPLGDFEPQDSTRDPEVEIGAVHSALQCLPEGEAQVVRSRFFAGLTNEQVAEQLGVSVGIVKARWIRAKARLHRELSRR